MLWGTARCWAPNVRVRVVNGVTQHQCLIRDEMDGLVGRSHRDSQGGTKKSNWVKDGVQVQIIIGTTVRVMDSIE